jgi:hypothetical protein|tara:strand:- start:114 stop:263 length:150 start_codon:yes stop_codon:yes gene_type:complete
MSKWSEEFIGMYEDTRKLRKAQTQWKKGNPKEAAKIRKIYGRFEIKKVK